MGTQRPSVNPRVDRRRRAIAAMREAITAEALRQLRDRQPGDPGPIGVVPMAGAGRCPASSWRGGGGEFYGPGAFNRCSRAAGHPGWHFDEWGNEWDRGNVRHATRQAVPA